MRKLGEYLLKGPVQAILVTSAGTLIGVMLTLFSYLFSGLPPALVTLRKGITAGIQVMTGSLIVVGLFTLAAGIQSQLAIAIALGVWLPVAFCATVLRMTESQGRLVLAAGICGMLYVLLMHILIEDVAGWWKGWLDLWIAQAVDAARRSEYQDIMAHAAPLMTAMTGAGLMISLVTTIMAARWWQSLLFNPGGFRREFYALALPRSLMLAVLAGLGLLVAGQAEPGSLALDLLILLMFLYLFQGLAVIHRTVAGRKLAQGWLVGMYLLLLILPQALLFVACLGMVDSWRIRALPGPNGN